MLHAELLPATDGSSRRLIVVLHGLGDSIEGYRWMPPTLGFPWLNYLLVNAPDDYFGGYSWYDYESDPAPDIERSRGLLVELLDAQRDRGFASEETVLFGFSQGCLMAVDTGLRYPHRLAAIVGISGYVHEPQTLLQELSPVAREQRLLITHGTFDPVVPFAPSKLQFQMLKSKGLPIEWHEFEKEHTIDGETELSVIRRFIQAGFET